MINTPNFKNTIFDSGLTKFWVPKLGDFWSCSCSSCLNNTKVYAIETADLIAIEDKVDLQNYMSFMANAVITSRDCGFGAFWENRHESENDFGYIWLPKMDQLLRLCGLAEYGSGFLGALYDKITYPIDTFAVMSRFLMWIRIYHPDVTYESIEAALLHRIISLCDKKG